MTDNFKIADVRSKARSEPECPVLISTRNTRLHAVVSLTTNIFPISDFVLPSAFGFRISDF
jgi:hypothetical protein